ncbi:hypothetical protein [Nocardia paucivorans]|nr:hypothetical protein [Nocardia paucivorans]
MEYIPNEYPAWPGVWRLDGTKTAEEAKRWIEAAEAASPGE